MYDSVFSHNLSVILVFNPWISKGSVQDELVRMQPKFKQNLLEGVAIFQNNVNTFMEQYDTVSHQKIFC